MRIRPVGQTEVSSGVTSGPTITEPGPPCLSPTSLDTSAQLIQPGSGTNTITGSVVPPVRKHLVALNSELPASMQLHMELVFNVRNSVQFKQCLSSLSDPASNNYGHFLNSTTLKPYLPTPGQKSSVVAFLETNGFTVTEGFSPLVLNVNGTVVRAEQMFGVKIGLYGTGSNSSFYATDSDPSLPMNLAGLTRGILGLDNYTTVNPAESPCSGPFCPKSIQVGYSILSLLASGKDGTGTKVAIVDRAGDPNIQAAINVFSTQYGLPSTTLDVYNPEGNPLSYDATWAPEVAMDVEAVRSVAPGAGIVLLYDTGDMITSIDYVANNHLASIVSNSWSYICGTNQPCSDAQLPLANVLSVDSRLQIDASQGLTILFASGDYGAKPDGSNLGPVFPASDPNVLAVGATNLALTGCGSSTCAGYSSESGAPVSGGGISGVFQEPTWQASTIGSKSGTCIGGSCRAVPDVSMLGLNPGIWVYSTISAGACKTANGQAGWYGCSGTSLSTPLWAGFLAIALQMKGVGSFGNLGPKLYQVASGAAYPTAFHDITSGNNGWVAGPGWDLVTGWGSPIASVLATLLVQSISLAPNRGGIGTSVAITGSGFTSDDTSCSIASLPSGLMSSPACTIANGSVTASFAVASGAALGSYTVTVTGSPDLDVASAPFTVTLSLSLGGSAMLSAPVNNAYFIFPDSNMAHKKPTGVGYASVTDWTALGFVYGSLTYMPQFIALDTDSSVIDQSTGAPKVSNKIIVLFGGPLVNEVVHYYESHGIAPLHWGLVGGFTSGTEYYYNRAGQEVAHLSISAITSNQDMALIEAFTDQNGNKVIIFSGFGWRGTFVGGIYFKTVLASQLPTMNNSWYIYSWADSNGNGFPEVSEVNSTPVNQGS